MQGVKQRETGKVMMEQERRCWAQHREEVRGHLVTVYQERSARGWGWRGRRGCWASVMGFHRPRIEGLCVWARTCVFMCVCVCVRVATAEMGLVFLVETASIYSLRDGVPPAGNLCTESHSPGFRT